MIRIRITRLLLTTHGHDASHVPHFGDLSRGQDFFARQEPALPARRRVLIRPEFPFYASSKISVVLTNIQNHLPLEERQEFDPELGVSDDLVISFCGRRPGTRHRVALEIHRATEVDRGTGSWAQLETRDRHLIRIPR